MFDIASCWELCVKIEKLEEMSDGYLMQGTYMSTDKMLHVEGMSSYAQKAIRIMYRIYVILG
jgi:hypothetical protein